MSGWDGLLNILRENRDEHHDWATSSPTACPNDGEPLDVDPNGDLRCINDGWTWDGTPQGKRGTA